MATAHSLELTRPRWRRGVLALIAGLHALLIWGLLQTMTRHEPARSLATLIVRIVAPEPAPSPASRAPAPRPAPSVPPAQVLMPTPELPATAQVTSSRPAAEITVAAVEPAPPMAVTAAPAAPVAPTIARVAPPERQIAITQVEYLTPPALSYPQSARRLREQGLVQVRVRVDESGRPAQFSVLRSSGSDRLDEAALATVRATRFKPYTEDGIARPFWVVMPLVFELDT